MDLAATSYSKHCETLKPFQCNIIFIINIWDDKDDQKDYDIQGELARSTCTNDCLDVQDDQDDQDDQDGQDDQDDQDAQDEDEQVGPDGTSVLAVAQVAVGAPTSTRDLQARVLRVRPTNTDT